MMLPINKVASWPKWVQLLIASIAVLLIAGCIFLLIPARTAGAEQNGDPVKGRAAAERWCSQCHVVTGKGQERVLDDTPTFQQLARDSAMTRKRLLAILRNPHEMPTVQLSKADVINIVAFIESLRRTGK